jgi:hypothetical protein
MCRKLCVRDRALSLCDCTKAQQWQVRSMDLFAEFLDTGQGDAHGLHVS